MARIPKQVTALLDALKTDLPLVLGGDLVGAYLYGSLTQRAFKAKRSDIDCIAVTKRELTDNQFADLEHWFAEITKTNQWTQRLQVSFLIRDEILQMDSPGCLYQFGKLTRSGSDGNPIIWLNVIDSGITIFGEPPEKFVPPITREVIAEALIREANYMRQEFDNQKSEWRNRPKYRAYAVLTLCRILYTHVKGKVVSKPQAAKWAFKNLPGEFHDIIRQSITAETDDEIGDIPLRRIKRLGKLADSELHAF